MKHFIIKFIAVAIFVMAFICITELVQKSNWALIIIALATGIVVKEMKSYD